MAKLVENSYRDVNIAFANELSLIAADLGIDVWELIRLANHHPRVNILNPGPGVGGHCIAIDPWFIVDAAPRKAHLIRAARNVNSEKPAWVAEQAIRVLRETGAATLGVFGLTFKANIDDLRESPAIEVVTRLLQEFSEIDIMIAEPHIDALPAALTKSGRARLSTFDDVVKSAKALLVLVDHDAFDFRKIQSSDIPIIDTIGVIR